MKPITLQTEEYFKLKKHRLQLCFTSTTRPKKEPMYTIVWTCDYILPMYCWESYPILDVNSLR